jgi:type IV pilus assembly protein PilM
VGLDIGSSSVKVVEIDHSGDHPRLVRYGLRSLLPEAIVDGEIMDHDVVVDTIAELMEEQGIRTRDVVIGVSGRALIVKVIQMDRMSDEEVSYAVEWEAEQHIPFEMDDVSLDFQMVDREAAPDRMDIVLVAARKEMIEARTDLVRAAGLDPVVVDVDSFAVQNAFEIGCGSSAEADAVTVLLNVGCYASNLNIVKDGIPRFTRDLSFAGNNILEAVQKELGMDRDGARHALGGPNEAPSADVRSVVEKAAGELSASVAKSFSYLQSSGEAESIDRICLSGGGGMSPGLRECLEKGHGVPVEIANPFRSLEWAEGLFAEEEPEDVASRFMVATGLALRGGEHDS